MKPKIVIALTPRQSPAWNLPKRIIKLGQGLANFMPEFEVLVSRSSVPRMAHSLNLLIDKFREEKENEWFVWMDINTEIDAPGLHQLFLAQKAVIGALVTTCEKNAQWAASFYPDIPADENGVLPVPELDVGVKIFHRSIFDLIDKDVPMYVYDNSGHSVKAFCQERVVPWLDYNRMLSASQYLDLLCRNAKIGVFAHTKVTPYRRDLDGSRYPAKTPYRPWMFKRLPPPVCAEELPEVEWIEGKVRVILQWCRKDEELARRIKERMYQMSGLDVEMEFSEGEGYPSGPNQTALRLLHNKDGESGVKAILLMEPDCCPLTPDWLDQLSKDWDRCAAAGKLIMGSWHPVNADHPTLGHINGCLMFAPDLSKRITIPDVPDDKPWDTYLADVLAPVWARTGLIKNLNRHKTATVEQLTKPECGTRPPILIHGVKDSSAWDYAASIK